MGKEASLRANKQHRPQVQKRPSVYNQRAKEGFKFWLEEDPMINRVSRKNASETFGSRIPHFLNLMTGVCFKLCPEDIAFALKSVYSVLYFYTFPWHWCFGIYP